MLVCDVHRVALYFGWLTQLVLPELMTHVPSFPPDPAAAAFHRVAAAQVEEFQKAFYYHILKLIFY
jgi:hypothetical protein